MHGIMGFGICLFIIIITIICPKDVQKLTS